MSVCMCVCTCVQYTDKEEVCSCVCVMERHTHSFLLLFMQFFTDRLSRQYRHCEGYKQSYEDVENDDHVAVLKDLCLYCVLLLLFVFALLMVRYCAG